MRRLVIPLLLCLSLAACSSDDADEPDSSPAPGASDSATASTGATASDSGTAAASASGKTDDELASVIDDANRVTPPLEAYFFGAGPADTLEEAVTALADLKLELSPGNEVGSYVYDEADEDFRLCIQGPTGAFATYDTSPMSLFETGESGGCP